MRRITFAVTCGLLLSVAQFATAQEFEMAKPTEEHQWLKQFTGTWDAKMEATVEPNQPPVECTGKLTSKPLGELWVINEFENEMQGTAVKGLQTLGYDPEKKKFVGTWVDSAMNHIWKYSGTVDKTGKKLTLEAEGPNPMVPGTMSLYRDSYEFKSKDVIIATSSVKIESGEWVEFMRGELTRTK